MSDDDRADIDDDLDLIRIADHEQARKLFRACLDCAFHEGRAFTLKRLISKERNR